MIGRRFRPAGKMVLAMTITAGMTACSSSASQSTTATSPTPSTSSTGTTGPHARVAIPDVIGDDEQFAEQLLAFDGIRPVKEDSMPNLYYNVNYAIGTNPPGETKVVTGSPVVLFLSGGITSFVSGGPKTVGMPDVLKLTFQVANTMLVEHGITLCPPIFQASAKPAGQIIGSVPAARQKFVAYGGKTARPVVVTVSSGRTTSPGPSSSAGSPNGC
jgi:eukaryotic-like serine/threonine-protein kinase